MSEEAGVTAGSEAVPLPADAPESFNSPSDAASFLAEWREKRETAESADPATAAHELPVEGNADPENPAPGEDEDADPAQPPIERPKSWTESEEAEWRATPRALQQKIAARELERDNALRRAQNDAAEKLKGLTTKEQQAEEARHRYEAKLPEVMQGLTDYNNRQFADIKSMADLETLANEALRLSTTDPVAAGQIQAYLNAWQVHQQKMAATKAELDQANQRKTTKEQADWAEFVSTNNAKAAERIPDLADKDKSQALTNKAGELLRELGFSEEDLDGFTKGQKISPYDHRIQALLFEAITAKGMQQAKATLADKVAPKTLPPVQRPGTSRPTGAGNAERIQALESKLNNSGSQEDAFELLMARRNALRAS